MKIGFIGLGKMGGDMVRRLLQRGHQVVAYDRDARAMDAIKQAGAGTAGTIEALAAALPAPRVVWIMVPAGEITEEVISGLSAVLEKNDIIIDGGNSHYKDSVARGRELRTRGIHFIDAGVSGGIWGLREGYCIMAGGDKEICRHAEPLFTTLAQKDGYAYMGPSGAGHFVKMVHNGIEYAMLQAYAEGFELLQAKKDYGLDLGSIARLWNHGSVVRSWLLELAERAFAEDPRLETIKGYVQDSGEGRWTVEEAMDLNVPAPAIALSLFRRFASRQEESFGAKVIAALRREFGGHAVKTGEGPGGKAE